MLLDKSLEVSLTYEFFNMLFQVTTIRYIVVVIPVVVIRYVGQGKVMVRSTKFHGWEPKWPLGQ